MRSTWIVTVYFQVLGIEFQIALCLMIVPDLIQCEFSFGWKECVELGIDDSSIGTAFGAWWDGIPEFWY